MVLDDQTLHTWIVDDFETNPPTQGKVQSEKIIAMSITPDSEYATCIYNDQSVKKNSLKDLKTYKSSSRIHKSGLTSVACIENFIITSSKDQQLAFFPSNEFKSPNYQIDEEKRGPACIAVTSNYIISGSTDLIIRIWDRISNKIVHRFKDVHHSAITCLRASKAGDYVYSSSEEGTVKAWNLKEFGEPRTLMSTEGDPIYSITLSPDSKYLIATTAKDLLVCNSLGVSSIYAKSNIHSERIISVKVLSTDDPSTHMIITTGKDNFIKQWEMKPSKESSARTESQQSSSNVNDNDDQPFVQPQVFVDSPDVQVDNADVPLSISQDKGKKKIGVF